MTVEDDFPGFMIIYRKLRQEGICFPPKDPNFKLSIEDQSCAETPNIEFQIDESEEHYGIQPFESCAECNICFNIITDVIMMCPKDGNTILCQTCLGKIENSKCPVCKEKVDYIRNRPLEKTLAKELEVYRQGFC